MEVLWVFFWGGVCVGQPKSQLCFAKGRELKGLLRAMAEQLQPRRNFARVEEGKKGSAGLEKAVSSCACPAWEPWGPWTPAQRRRASSEPPHDNPDEPHPFSCLPKASPPSANTRRWFLLEVLQLHRGDSVVLEGLRVLAPPNPARRMGPREVYGMPRWHRASPRKAGMFSPRKDAIACTFLPWHPDLFSPRVTNSAIISPFLQGWATFFCFAAAS